MKAGERRVAEILSFPAMKQVPAPDLPLKGRSYDKYHEIATALLAGNKLNMHTKALCEQVGIIHGEIYQSVEFGRPVSAKKSERLEKLLRELRLVDDSDAVAAESEETENRFSRFGQITRRGAKKTAIRAS